MPETFFHIFLVVLLVIFAGFLIFLIRKILQTSREWKQNNQAPQEAVPATVISKSAERFQKKQKHLDGADSGIFHVRFRLEDGTEAEFQVFEEQYAGMEEGDVGVLHRQGTRFLRFEKTGKTNP